MSDEILIRLAENARKIVLWVGDGIQDSRPICYGGVALLPCSLSAASMLIGMKRLNVVDFVISENEKDAYRVADEYATFSGAVVARA